MNTQKVFIGAIVVLLIGMGIYFIAHELQRKNGDDQKTFGKKEQKQAAAQTPIVGNGTPTDWVVVTVANQPALSKKPQELKLPVGWTAREDYLLTVVPPTLPGTIRNYRSVIMRPPKFKTMSREDAIYTVPDASLPYFKDHCKQNGALFLCYGGENTDTKAVFDMLQ